MTVDCEIAHGKPEFSHSYRRNSGRFITSEIEERIKTMPSHFKLDFMIN